MMHKWKKWATWEEKMSNFPGVGFRALILWMTRLCRKISLFDICAFLHLNESGWKVFAIASDGIGIYRCRHHHHQPNHQYHHNDHHNDANQVGALQSAARQGLVDARAAAHRDLQVDHHCDVKSSCRQVNSLSKFVRLGAAQPLLSLTKKCHYFSFFCKTFHYDDTDLAQERINSRRRTNDRLVSLLGLPQFSKVMVIWWEWGRGRIWIC